MQNSSVALTLELAAATARSADESGSGVASTAETALVEVIGQVIFRGHFRGDRFPCASSFVYASVRFPKQRTFCHKQSHDVRCHWCISAPVLRVRTQ